MAYLAAAATFVVYRPLSNLFVDNWRWPFDRFVGDLSREVRCFFSAKVSCCGWGKSCPIAETLISGMFAAALTIVPVVLLIWLTRRFHWHRPAAELLSGAGLGLVAGALFFSMPEEVAGDEGSVGRFVVSGIVGAIVYWLAAGMPKRRMT